MSVVMTGRQKLIVLCVVSVVGVAVELGLCRLFSAEASQAQFLGVMIMLSADAALGCWCVAHDYTGPWIGMLLIQIPLARVVVGELSWPWVPIAFVAVCLGICLVWYEELRQLMRRRT
jgi:hypothetical protein